MSEAAFRWEYEVLIAKLRADNLELLEALQYCERQLEQLAEQHCPGVSQEMRTYNSARHARFIIAKATGAAQ